MNYGWGFHSVSQRIKEAENKSPFLTPLEGGVRASKKEIEFLYNSESRFRRFRRFRRWEKSLAPMLEAVAVLAAVAAMLAAVATVLVAVAALLAAVATFQYSFLLLSLYRL